MKCCIFLILSICTFVCFSIGENNQSRNDPVNSKVVIDSLFTLSTDYISFDNEIALLYAKKGKQLLDGTNYKLGFHDYYFIRARIAYYDDDYFESLNYLDSVRLFLDFEKDTPELAQYYSLNGLVQKCLGNYQKSIEFTLEAIKVRGNIEDISGIAMGYNFLGNLYLVQKDLESAENYFQMAMDLNIKLINPIGYGNILLNNGKLKEEQDSLYQALNIYNEAYNLFVENGGLRGIASALYQIARVEDSFHKYKKAIIKLNEAEQIYLKLNEKYGLTFIYNQLSETYRKAGKLKQAIDYGNKANQLAAQINSDPMLADSYLKLYEAHKVSGNYSKALKEFEKYEKINTELISWENNKRISTLELQSQMMVKEKDIEILRQKSRNKTIQLYFLIPVFLLVIFGTFSIIQTLRLKNKTLRQKQTILEKKNKIIEVENKLHQQNQIILENDLELKNRELASKALGILQLNETLHDIGEKLNEIKPDKMEFDKRIKNELIREIQFATNGNIWEEFDFAFKQVHTSFYDKLLEECPNLSSTEIKIAALLRLNLSTKEIASITFKSESAIKVARHRIRNKIGLKQNESLTSFLLKLN